MIPVKPKKSLGQHFLTNLETAARIACTLDAHSDLPVLEIGPGMGVLTRFLLEKHDNLKVVELDRESVRFLQIHFPALEGKIIEGDFLRLPLDTLFPGPFCVIGNYPYNISSQILFRVLEHKDIIPFCAGMFQKEVAERIASKPGKKAYGILSVLLQAYYDIDYLFTVDKQQFDPPPAVQSAVIRLVRNDVKTLDCNEQLFKQVVKTGFNQRRKTLRNSLKVLIGKDCPFHDRAVFDKRPEQLSVQEFIELTNLVESCLTAS
ncbi:MAG: Ribosomal RNA small subunit methyltransferase A [Bacteroidetes bacterium ADurb.Bin416]|jgi:16S rRNA (adenine1518-N6/adenine1519-N6)-dimethyltransferase|nr:MAG: Ribosomal RNA small subunit methyltransferase A [Bacteroidetes bacterium ADurb.Bin416]